MSQTHKHMVSVFELPEAEADYDPKWDERFQDAAEATSENVDWPKLSIVTPSFNQGRFIERTIRCILLQGYPNLEYIIIDGGSTDETVKIIKKYEPWISSWISEPDTGMYDAINKGFERSTGEIMAWSPTGDIYEPGALRVIGETFRQIRVAEWITSLHKIRIDELGEEVARYRVSGFCRSGFRKGLYIPGGNQFASYTIQQQSTFWRRGLWERAGGAMDSSMKGSGDYELWSRFVEDSPVHCVDRAIGVFMVHEGQESVANAENMNAEHEQALRRMGGSHMSKFEGWLRMRLLRKRPFRVLSMIPGIGYRTNIVSWNEDSRSATSRRAIFV